MHQQKLVQLLSISVRQFRITSEPVAPALQFEKHGTTRLRLPRNAFMPQLLQASQLPPHTLARSPVTDRVRLAWPATPQAPGLQSR